MSVDVGEQKPNRYSLVIQWIEEHVSGRGRGVPAGLVG